MTTNSHQDLDNYNYRYDAEEEAAGHLGIWVRRCYRCGTVSEVTDTFVTPGADPYEAYRLSCGHSVI